MLMKILITSRTLDRWSWHLIKKCHIYSKLKIIIICEYGPQESWIQVSSYNQQPYWKPSFLVKPVALAFLIFNFCVVSESGDEEEIFH